MSAASPGTLRPEVQRKSWVRTPPCCTGCSPGRPTRERRAIVTRRGCRPPLGWARHAHADPSRLRSPLFVAPVRLGGCRQPVVRVVACVLILIAPQVRSSFRGLLSIDCRVVPVSRPELQRQICEIGHRRRGRWNPATVNYLVKHMIEHSFIPAASLSAPA